MELATERIVLGDPANRENSRQFMEFVRNETGQDIRLCYQCGKCTAGCPSSYIMDLTPRQMMRAIQFGLRENLLKSSAIWLCVSCQVCTARCPREIDIARVIEALRHLAVAEKRSAAEKEISLSYSLFLRLLTLFGRIYEVGLAGLYNLGSGHLMTNIDLLPEMLSKGKLLLFPSRAGDVREIRKIFNRVKMIESESH